MKDRRPSRTNLAWVVLTLLLIFARAYHGSVLPVLVIGIGSLFPLTTALVGMLLSSAAIGNFLVCGFIGPMIDYHGARKVLLAGAAGIAASLVAGGSAQSYTMYLLAAIALSVAYGALSMSIPLYIIALYPGWQRKGFALNLVTGAVQGLYFPYLAERLTEADSVPFTTVFRVPYLIIGAMCTALFCCF